MADACTASSSKDENGKALIKTAGVDGLEQMDLNTCCKVESYVMGVFSRHQSAPSAAFRSQSLAVDHLSCDELNHGVRLGRRV